MNQSDQSSSGLLQGQKVAFTGRLACMTRSEAADLVTCHGGEFVLTVNRLTSLVVIGQEGWPLRKDGRLSAKLQKARRLQRAGCLLDIISEEELLSRIGLLERSQAICQRYTISQLSQLLGVRGERIRAWMRRGLIRPIEIIDGVPFFDFYEVSSVRMLCRLERTGVSIDRVRHSLQQITGWLPAVERPLAQLAALEQTGQMLVRLENGCLAEPSGQLWFDFGDAAEPNTVLAQQPSCSAEGYYEQALLHEQAGRLNEALAAYAEADRLGDLDADGYFNLANVFFNLGLKEQAIERYRQAVELDPRQAEAWNNLGNALVDKGEVEDAVMAYRHALRAEPCYADAHYNVADALEQLGRHQEARPHWEAYLQRDRSSPWADYARHALSSATGA